MGLAEVGVKGSKYGSKKKKNQNKKIYKMGKLLGTGVQFEM